MSRQINWTSTGASILLALILIAPRAAVAVAWIGEVVR